MIFNSEKKSKYFNISKTTNNNGIVRWTPSGMNWMTNNSIDKHCADDILRRIKLKIFNP